MTEYLHKRSVRGFFLLLIAIHPALGQHLQYTVHVDKPFYVTGETIYYAIYPPSGTVADIVLEVSLIGATGDNIGRSRHRIGHETPLTGQFRIPTSNRSGVYHVVVRGTNSMAYKVKELVRVALPVYNDLVALPEEIAIVNGALDVVQKTSSPGSPDFENNLKVKIASEKGRYRQQDQVTLNVEVLNAGNEPRMSHLSISVTDKNLIDPKTGRTVQTQQVSREVQNSLDSVMVLMGLVTSAEGPVDRIVLDIYLPLEKRGITVNTLDNGEFRLEIPDFYGQQYLSIYDHFKLFNPETSTSNQVNEGALSVSEINAVQMPAVDFVYTTESIKYIELSRKRRQIDQLYGKPVPTGSVPVVKEKNKVSPDRLIRLQDYEPFPDLPAFFDEISTPLKFLKAKKGSDYIAKMFNPAVRKFYNGAPLFILDEILTSDVRQITNLNIAEIEQIELYYDEEKLKRQFGLMGYGGVIIISTNKGRDRDLLPNEMVIDGLSSEDNSSRYGEVNYPDFRPQLYWNGRVRTDTLGKAQITFRHSNDIGHFNIEVVAQDDQGEMGYGVAEYEVVW